MKFTIDRDMPISTLVGRYLTILGPDYSGKKEITLVIGQVIEAEMTGITNENLKKVAKAPLDAA
jgi:hypothetical protein